MNYWKKNLGGISLEIPKELLKKPQEDHQKILNKFSQGFFLLTVLSTNREKLLEEYLEKMAAKYL